MAVGLRDLEQDASVVVETEHGPARLRRFLTDDRFDAVHASVIWTSSGENRWGRVAIDRGRYIAQLYEKIRTEVPV